MKKKVLAVTLCLILAISVSACKKKETKPPVPQTPGPMAPGPISPEQMPPGQMPPGPMMQGPISPEEQQSVPRPGMTMPKGKTRIVVPEAVRGNWSAVKIVVEDKITKKIQEYAVNLNSDFTIPNSNLNIHVGEFLPDFKMEGLVLTSRSNEPKNPAVGIRVFEGNKQIFPAPGKQWGWLWSHKELQTAHPFNHPRYSLTLKEGVLKKGLTTASE
ncbi:MAG: hypothetical protein AB1478_00425 [Nitrospirota bacterium]